MHDVFSRSALQAGLAELVGTFFLTLAALIGGSPYAIALTLAAFVYTIGTISGCNINPAVTLGLVVARRLSVARGLLYLYAQVIGALLARVLAPLVRPLPPSYHAAGPAAECVGVGFLLITVLAVSDKYVPKSGSGLAIGAALAAGLVTSNGILNPAIAVAMDQALSPATWATLAGSILFATLFRLVAPKDAPHPGASSAA